MPTRTVRGSLILLSPSLLPFSRCGVRAAPPPSYGNLGSGFRREIQLSLLIQLPLKLHPLKNRICDSLIFSSERSQKLKHFRPLCFGVLYTPVCALCHCHFIASFHVLCVPLCTLCVYYSALSVLCQWIFVKILKRMLTMRTCSVRICRGGDSSCPFTLV